MEWNSSSNIFGPEGNFHCKNCSGFCCLDPEPPYLLRDDIQNIAQYTGRDALFFVNNKAMQFSDGPHSVKQNSSGHCMFYDDKSSQCTIYPARPVDCQLFPLDIHKISDTFFWILYDLCPLSEIVLAKHVDKAEKHLLPKLLGEIDNYENQDFDLFRQGRWKIVRPVNLPSNLSKG